MLPGSNCRCVSFSGYMLLAGQLAGISLKAIDSSKKVSKIAGLALYRIDSVVVLTWTVTHNDLWWWSMLLWCQQSTAVSCDVPLENRIILQSKSHCFLPENRVFLRKYKCWCEDARSAANSFFCRSFWKTPSRAKTRRRAAEMKRLLSETPDLHKVMCLQIFRLRSLPPQKVSILRVV